MIPRLTTTPEQRYLSSPGTQPSPRRQDHPQSHGITSTPRALPAVQPSTLLTANPAPFTIASVFLRQAAICLYREHQTLNPGQSRASSYKETSTQGMRAWGGHTGDTHTRHIHIQGMEARIGMQGKRHLAWRLARSPSLDQDGHTGQGESWILEVVETKARRYNWGRLTPRGQCRRPSGVRWR